MSRALLYLLVTQRRNGAIQFVKGLRRPRKLFGVLFWVLMIGGLAGSQLLAVRAAEQLPIVPPRSGAAPLTVLLGFLLVASALGGLMQRGMAFQAADIDFLFPGPFERRRLVLYRLLSLYPMTLLSTLILMAFVGPRLESPWLGLVAVLLCQLVGLHLQTTTSILAATIGDRTFRRLRGGMQIFLVLLFSVGMFAGITAFTGAGGLGGAARRLFSTDLVATLLYPATAAARVSSADGFREAVLPLLGLVGSVLLTLAVVLVLQVNFFEASLDTSQRIARLRSKMQRGIAARAHAEGERVRAIRLPGARIFSGGGAVLWKNLHAAGRSLRIVFFGLVMTAIFTSVALSVGGGFHSSGPAAALNVLGIGAVLPFMLQQYVAFDFRRDIESIAELKLLPVSAFVLAAAEVAVPTLLALLYQGVLIAVVAIVLEPPGWVILVQLVVYPAITLAICTVVNIGFLLFPVKTVTAAGRPNPGGASLSALVNMLVLAVAMIPAVAVGLGAGWLLDSTSAGVAAGVAVQYAVDLAMLWFLGRLFRSFDVSKEQ